MLQPDRIERLFPVTQDIGIESQEDMLQPLTDHRIERFQLFHPDTFTIRRVGDQHTSIGRRFGVLLQRLHTQINIFFQTGTFDIFLRDGDGYR